MSLRVHEPFQSMQKAIEENSDIVSSVDVFETTARRLLVEDTDEGEEIRARIRDLKLLVEAYRTGLIKP